MTESERTEMLIRIDERVNSMHSTVSDILKETRATNGRVTKLEAEFAQEKTRVQTAYKTTSIIWGIGLAIVSAIASVTAILMLLK